MARALVIPVLFILVMAPGAWAVEARVAATAVCVFPLSNLTPDGKMQEHQKPLSEAVAQEFAAVGYHMVADNQWQAEAAREKVPGDRITEAPVVLRLGQGAGADMAVSGFYWMEGGRILISIQCYDVKAGTLITGFLHTWRFNLGFYNSIHAEIADLVQKVVFLTAPRLITLKDSVRVDQITFTSPQNGMEVWIEGQNSAGRIQDGTLVFDTGGIKAGTPLLVEKRQEGYHPLSQSIIVAPEVALTPLPRENKLSLELDWTAGQLEGAGATLRWYPVPDWIMLNFSEYLYAQIPYVSNASLPVHADSELLAGLYLFMPPQSNFRFGLSTGVGTILSWIPGTTLPLYTDVYLNLLSLWAEYKVAGFPILLRMDLKIPLGVGANLLGGGNVVTWGGGIPPITIGMVLPWK